MALTAPHHKTLFPALLLLALCLLTFANALNHPFMMDDRALITENANIGTLRFLQLDSSQEGNVYFRPVSHLFVFIPYMLFGLNPFGFHAFSLILFFLACVSIYELILHLFKNQSLALVTSLLFATHPINGVLVNYKTASAFSIMIMAMNFSLLLALPFYKSHLSNKKLLSIFAFSIALLCHETAAILPFYLILVLCKVQGMSLKRAVRQGLAHLIVLGLYLILRTRVASLQTGLLENFSFFNFTLDSYAASLINLLYFYLKNLILLKDIVLMWATPIIGDQTALWISLFALLTAYLLYLLIGRWRSDVKSTALLWVMLGGLPLLLASISRPNLGMLIEPHWMFYSTIGYCLLIASLLLTLSQQIHQMAFVGAAILIVSYSTVSMAYNSLWHDEKTYCKYIVHMSPQMDLPFFWLGYAYMEEKNYTAAEAAFKKSIKGQFSDEWSAYLNLGLIKQEQRKFDEALNYYRETWIRKPNAPEIYNNVGALFIEAGNFEQAKRGLKECLRIDPKNIRARKNLATVSLHEGNTPEAIRLYQEVLAINPQEEYVLLKLKELSMP